jgi:hypothetical protein
MKTPETKLLATETDLKQLMADVSRAMEKAERAVARVSGKSGGATAEDAAAAAPQGA